MTDTLYENRVLIDNITGVFFFFFIGVLNFGKYLTDIINCIRTEVNIFIKSPCGTKYQKCYITN